MSIKIITDSASDITQEEAKKKNINVIPMNILIGDKNYLDGIDLNFEEFYKSLHEVKEFPKTSQPSPDAFIKCFEEAKKNNDDVIAILLSSGLSGTYQCANLAKNTVDYDKIHIIDSLSAFTGERLLVDYAIKLRNDGSNVNEIIEKIENIKNKIVITSLVDTLEYAYRGGRLTRIQAIIGSLLNLKLMLKLDINGKLILEGKTLGKTRGFREMFKTLERKPIDERYPVYFAYCENDGNCQEMLTKFKEKYPNISDIIISQIGPTIGSHIGPNGFSIFYIRKTDDTENIN